MNAYLRQLPTAAFFYYIYFSNKLLKENYGNNSTPALRGGRHYYYNPGQQKKKSPPSRPIVPPEKSTENLVNTESNPNESLRYDINEDQQENEYEIGFEEFKLTGVHLPRRKDYILENCNEEDKLEFLHDKNNPVNPMAIAVKHQGFLIGYIADDDLDYVHELMQHEHETMITNIAFDGEFLDVEVELEYTIPVIKKKRKAKTPKVKREGSFASNADIGPEDFMIWKANEIPSEYLKPKKDVEDTSSFFYGKKVCISGQLDSFPYRAELARYLWEVGADVESNVGKTCGILIAGDGVGPSKLKRAEEQGVIIIDERELTEKLNGFKSKYL